MNSRHLGLFVIALTAAIAAQAQQNTILPDYPNNYTMYEDLVQMPNGRQMGSGTRPQSVGPTQRSRCAGV